MLPIVGTLIGDELKEAIARAVLARKGIVGEPADRILAASAVAVEWKNALLPGGGQHLIATAGIFARASTDTPTPEGPAA